MSHKAKELARYISSLGPEQRKYARKYRDWVRDGREGPQPLWFGLEAAVASEIRDTVDNPEKRKPGPKPLPENQGRVQLYVEISPTLKDRIFSVARTKDMTARDFVEATLENATQAEQQ